ncbi:hypothetical protein CF319_g6565 [Tilletia indica]|nr:hypothetical protein CF319_g6565 [Tilletia indica]
MATRRTTAALRTADRETIVISDSQGSTDSSFSCTSSHREDSQDVDEDYGEYEPDASQVIDSQGPTVGDELHGLLEDPATVDMDMELHAHQHTSTTTSAAPPSRSATPVPEPSKATTVEDAEDESDVQASAESPSQETLSAITVWISDDAQHPSFVFEEFKDTVLSGANALGPNTVLYEFDTSLNPNNVDHTVQLRSHCRKRWFKLGGTNVLKLYILPATGRARRVHVVYPTVEDFSYANELTLYWKHKGHQPTAYGPALDNRYTLVVVQVPVGDDTSAASDAFFNSVQSPDCQVVVLWAIQSAPANMPEWADYTGHFVAIVFCPGDRSIAGLIAAWTRLAGKDYENIYAGRLDHCRICRSRTDSFHLTEDCHTHDCIQCGGRHRSRDCPQLLSDSQSDTAAPEDAVTPSASPTEASTNPTSTAPTVSRPTTPTGAPQPAAPITPRTPTRAPPRPLGSATASSKSSPGLLSRLSAAPTPPSNAKGKGRQQSITSFLVPKSSPIKRAAPSAGSSASTSAAGPQRNRPKA